MKTSAIGRKLIKTFEGYRSEAYLCPAGIPTIGYGHTSGVVMGDTCTRQEAEEFLIEDLRHAENIVNAQNLDLNQHQFDALVSFVYNVGSGNFQDSTLLKLLKQDARAYDTLEEEWKKWKHSNGRVLKGLVRRRAAEWSLYKNGFFLLTLPVLLLAAVITIVLIKKLK
ncbi:MAG: lysozyme [Bacteroidales bacterium]|nr:lysozyme [Bacteroidales bacterium]